MKLSDYGKLTGENYVVIQTTSVGLYPNCDDAVIEDEDFYKRAAVGVDIIYNPAETKFMKLMKAQGKPAYNGLKMLLYQGVSAFELWNDMKVSKETIRRDLRELENDALLKRTHGGAVSTGTSHQTTEEYPYLIREIQYLEEKERICRKAASLVQMVTRFLLTTVLRILLF